MKAEDIYQAAVRLFQREITFEELEQIYEEYMKESRRERLASASFLAKRYSDILESCKDSFLYYYFCSFLIYATESVALYNDFLRACLNDGQLALKTKFALYSYAGRLQFLGILSGNEETSELLDRLYQRICLGFREEICGGYFHIPRGQRNQSLVFVLTSQFLALEHGPTKTTLDRTEVLKTVLKKDVFIINTAELMTDQNQVALFRDVVGNYIEQYNDLDFFTYHDVQYPFFQCPNEMPSASVIKEILDVVADEKPLCIVTIGGNSVVSDLCSMIVPTIVVSTVPSSRSRTYGQFQAIGAKVSEDDLAWAARHGMPKEHFIESIFTSSFKEQEHIYKRRDLNLPENTFIVALVGGRLDDELTEECLNMLEKLMEQGIYIAFIGGLEKYKELKRNSLYAEYGINMGVQEDVLAVLECMDVYINPRRMGGGTSVTEALYKGVPVVTMNYGDGGLGAGEDFWVEGYDGIYEAVLRYRSDSDYYSDMSRKAKARAEVLTNSSKEFTKIMETAMSRDGFQ